MDLLAGEILTITYKRFVNFASGIHVQILVETNDFMMWFLEIMDFKLILLRNCDFRN